MTFLGAPERPFQANDVMAKKRKNSPSSGRRNTGSTPMKLKPTEIEIFALYEKQTKGQHSETVSVIGHQKVVSDQADTHEP